MTAGNYTIIGGGIAGLAAGLAVAKQGASARIFEQAKQFEQVGAGLQLGPNAASALQALGAWDAVSLFTYAPPALLIRDGSSGRLLKHIDLGQAFSARFGQPYRVLHRAELHAGLLAAVKQYHRVEIILGQAVDYRSFKGAVIGADGINSQTRPDLFPGSAAQTLRGKIYRALLPVPKLQDIAVECVNLWLFAKGHVVHYPVSGGKSFNLVAVTQGDLPELHFAKAAPDLRALLALAPHWLEWPCAYVPELPRWSNANRCLIGDAAHATLPYLAQGAAMALEDALVLSQTKMDFQAFASFRRARVGRLHRETLRSGKIYHLQGAQALARNTALRLMPQSRFFDRLAWIYETKI